MAVTILRKFKGTKIGDLVLDASMRETHSGEVEVPEHPVEEGANIADHARLKAEKVTIDGVVSNTPVLTDQRREAGDVAVDQRGRADTAYENLRRMKDARQVVKLVTLLREYDNMLLTSLSVPREPKTGEIVQFSATFSQVRIVRNEATRLPETKIPSTPTKKLDKGKLPTTPTPEATAKRSSFAFDTFEAIRGAIP